MILDYGHLLDVKWIKDFDWMREGDVVGGRNWPIGRENGDGTSQSRLTENWKKEKSPNWSSSRKCLIADRLSLRNKPTSRLELHEVQTKTPRTRQSSLEITRTGTTVTSPIVMNLRIGLKIYRTQVGTFMNLRTGPPRSDRKSTDRKLVSPIGHRQSRDPRTYPEFIGQSANEMRFR